MMPAQRRRSRNPGRIDAAIADTVSPPLAISWVSGRFYDSTNYIASLANTGVCGLNTYFIPVLVPHSVTVTSIGVETTVASSAGGLYRFAIYNSDPVSGLPAIRQVDAGTVASDTTGFLSAAISVVLKAGWHWTAISNYASPTTATVRYHASSGATIGVYQAASTEVPTATFYGIRIATSSLGVVTNGFPYYFFNAIYGSSTIIYDGSGQSYPRIMIGV